MIYRLFNQYLISIGYCFILIIMLNLLERFNYLIHYRIDAFLSSLPSLLLYSYYLI